MNDDTAPATKADIREIRAEMHQGFDDIKRYFDVAVETIRHDLLGVNRDQIEVLKDRSVDHEQRIQRLETTTGVLAV